MWRRIIAVVAAMAATATTLVSLGAPAYADKDFNRFANVRQGQSDGYVNKALKIKGSKTCYGNGFKAQVGTYVKAPGTSTAYISRIRIRLYRPDRGLYLVRNQSGIAYNRKSDNKRITKSMGKKWVWFPNAKTKKQVGKVQRWSRLSAKKYNIISTFVFVDQAGECRTRINVQYNMTGPDASVSVEPVGANGA